MKGRESTLQQYVSDMVAVERNLAAMAKRQLEDVKDESSEAGRIVLNLHNLAERHAEHLKEQLSALGGDPASGIKEAVSAGVGAMTGMYEKMRGEAPSKMVRDDYAALNVAAIGYTMLHTTGLALGDHSTAELAMRHLRHYTPMIMEINQIIPQLVVADLSNDVEGIDAMSAQQARANTQEAWRSPTGQANI